ncbi:PBP1A family penicillin-binding protein [Sphingomonas koreensis]|uniref:Penicillin-binding protein n=1 Tax=Sphingomonas koreensis TaxID=93064 RepID=A0A1L6J7Y7_9SPHN|nr:PBP1A family penicillin-binding protein [Sphingomonas koreensis]APR52028.1 penicillin-binding protein [Sphingomonas koreensis]MDC7812393.1 PBP1A family penicillin-binding protein [Sphingomonas koreensis]RSU22831.1 PBP1A family penicillin-binding protein [Sphingomonas koreensis]RSU30695.1 PBP1A family penicillin-binding protein [Sphingomonas koreensis]RSU31790.1 PBP1A family penicillin-binding protein [Sphingomonas koreensis]
MRYDTLYPEVADPRAPAVPPLDPFDGLGGGGDVPPAGPRLPLRRRPWWRWTMRGIAAFIVLFVVTIGWLVFTAPLSKSLEPPVPPSITLLSAEGTPIARTGAEVGKPVDATKLPAHVVDAFLAVEDRRFRSHWGIDPRGITRAFVNNVFTSKSSQGGSTITQQLAKNAFLSSKRTFGRKFQEVLIAFWLEAWLTKDEILSRYLSNVYFGDNQYGLDAAARHYFSRPATELTTGQAAMLAGLVKAPSRLAPSGNLKGAQERQAVVVGTMVDAGLLTEAEARAIGPARLRLARSKALPSGTYFTDWVLPEARDQAGELGAVREVTTTLETRMQRAAERAVRNAGLRQSQIAIVSMRPDGRVIAMVGGKNYGESPFNRATQARRQPGSTFKLFVYLAALRSGMTPDSTVLDEPVTIGEWKPKNSDGRYRGEITLRQAFARSSNVAAARLTKDVGPAAVIRAARDLGISTPIAEEASIALGTSTVSLLELTAAYAAIANGEAPVRPRGLSETDEPGWLDRFTGSQRPIGNRELAGMRELLNASVHEGTGRGAALSVETFGKTGTTQDNRDALFVGYADGIVTAVWMGNDDNTPNPGLAGGGAPARVWRDFMARALGVAVQARPEPVVENLSEVIDDVGANVIDEPIEIEGSFGGQAVGVRVNRDGSLEMTRPGRDPVEGEPQQLDPPPPPERDRRRREPVPGEGF